MRRYSDEFKEQIMKKSSSSNAQTVFQVSYETGISGAALYNWQKQFREQSRVPPDDPSYQKKWPGGDKFLVVVEAAAMNETEGAEYCRQDELYPEQIQRLNEACIQCNGRREDLDPTINRSRQKSKRLNAELQCKEKALAETAALQVLQKKTRHFAR